MSDRGAAPVVGPFSLVQGGFRARRGPAGLVLPPRLEAVVLSRAGDALIHYHRDQDRPDREWVHGEVISGEPAGVGVLWHVRGPRGGVLHAAVPERDGLLAHFVLLTESGVPGRWRRVDPLAELPVLGRPGRGGAFAGADAVAMADTALGRNPVLTAAPGLPDLACGAQGWQQALVQQGESVVLWHRQRWCGRVRWMPAACLRSVPGEAPIPEARVSIKLAQVTGERDSQLGRSATLSSSLSVSGIRGTDLGVAIEHAGERYLLFGDSHWTRPGRATRDAIARVLPQGPVTGLPGVELHGAPLRIVGGGATSREYDVPLDGFSHQDRLYVFFSSHHFARQQTMGRSLLTRCLEAELRISGSERRRQIRFERLGTFSDWRFINVSVVRRDGELFIWGSGSYRADQLRLARWDLTGLAAVPPGGRLHRPWPGLSYWAGLGAGGAPRWSTREADAEPVVRGAFGELSVRWLPEVERFVLLAMNGPEDPIGPSVTLRSARTPWGPWSPRRRLFDWMEHGQSRARPGARFIRALGEADPVGDAVFGPQRTMSGAAYAPYLFDSRLDGDELVLRYTLSTWNPYQVVLMEHRLDPHSL